MELKQLRHFVEVAALSSFTKAAVRLNMSQPPLTASIKQLERQLQTKLLLRTTRSVELTAEGRIFLRHAHRILEEARAALAATKSVGMGFGGVLRMGFVGSATYQALPRLIPCFRTLYPSVELVLQESTSAEILSGLYNDDLDLGLIRTPLAATAAVELHPVEVDRFALALPRSHRLAHDKTVRLAAFADEPFVTYSPKIVPSLHSLMMLTCQKAGFVPRVAQEAIQVQTVVSLVASGLGIALIPSAAARFSLPEICFRSLHPRDELMPIAIELCYRRERMTPQAEHFHAMATRQDIAELPLHN